MRRMLADQGLTTGPSIDFRNYSFYDLRASRLVEWMLWLIWNARVFLTFSQVPCTTFSIARHPKLRSAEHAWGHDPHEPATALGNWLFSVGMAAMLAHYLSGHGAGLRARESEVIEEAVTIGSL